MTDHVAYLPMRLPNQIVTGVSRLHTLLTNSLTRVSFDGETVKLSGPEGRARVELSIGSIDSVSVGRSLLRHRLNIRTTAGVEHTVADLERSQAIDYRDGIRELAKQRQPAVRSTLAGLTADLDQLFNGEGYVRRSEADTCHADLASLVSQCGSLVQDGLDTEARDEFRRLNSLRDKETFERVREGNNRRFLDRQIPLVQQTVWNAVNTRLTEEQAEAVATDEDVTLVLAGAGTGKTSVIVGKLAHLVRDRSIPPDEILVLAYNRKAAQEIRERLPGYLRDTHVSTFHSLGHRIIAESKIAPTVSRLAADQFAFTIAVDSILGELLNDPTHSRSLAEFIAYWQAPYRSAFEFRSRTEYDDYVRSIELRTLSGDLVKSYEELVIANYLTEHGVEFNYERPYGVRTATQRHRQYQPDFYLPEHDIYIEHFALDRSDNPPPGWVGYADGVAWKREIHRRYETRLIETYSWYQSEGVLRERLGGSLEAAGVTLVQRDVGPLVLELARRKISLLARLTTTFLTHAKTADLSLEELATRARRSGDPARAETFLGVYRQVRDRYEQILADEKAIDFHDLINHAVENISEGRWKQPFRYVLVDEFQDISSGRMRLLQAMDGGGVTFFLVGDDWQSIYRFAGSDVSLMRDCQLYLGHVQHRNLSRTWRFGKGILGPSTAFIQRNPEQTCRNLTPANVPEDRGITIVYDPNPANALLQALQDIQAATGEKIATVLVLGRYQRSAGLLPPGPHGPHLTVTFSTVHSAKGQEADYVIVLDLRDARTGFPSRIEDDPLLDLVLPPVMERSYPLAEERRLFYVAMTRARIGVYLVTDPVYPSEFVTELMEHSPDLPRIGESPPPLCPLCSGGRLIPSQNGRALRCTNRSSCVNTAPLCHSCNSGYTVVRNGASECLNPSCVNPGEACPLCRTGVLVVRSGRRGRFWGCTMYWSEPPCRFTRDASGSRRPDPARRR